MLISTIIFTDGEERQFRAETVAINEGGVGYLRIELGEAGQIIIPLTSVKEMHTTELSEDNISPELLG